jgi:hypothetical protein
MKKNLFPPKLKRKKKKKKARHLECMFGHFHCSMKVLFSKNSLPFLA